MPLLPDEVIESKYISRNKKTFGYYSGFAFANQIGITTQMPSVKEIVTSEMGNPIKRIEKGNRTFVVRKARTEITEDNAKVLQFMDLLKDIEDERNDIEEILKDYDIIMPNRVRMGMTNVDDIKKTRKYLEYGPYIEDYCKLRNILEKDYPDYLPFYDEMLNENKMYKNFVYATDNNFIGKKVYPSDMPVIINNFLESVNLLADAITSFTDNCVSGIKANREKMKDNLNNSLMLVTALSPHIGYENAAKVVHLAHEKGLTLKESTLSLGYLNSEEFDKYFKPEEMV